MARVGTVNSTIPLRSRFYLNGSLVNPYVVNDVRILTAVSGTLLDTITPTQVSRGLYQAAWDIPIISAGTYYDEWSWQAESGMGTQVRVYSFRVDAAPEVAVKKEASGPLFVGDREVNFFNGINKELLQKIVRQKLIYYSVSVQHTNTHKLYDEAVNKTVFTPVEIFALVLYKEPDQTVGKYSIDTIYSIETYFYQEELRERELIPREGDFVKFGNVVYEIEKLTRPQIVFGQISREVMVKANCRVARESQFKTFDGIPAVG
jgi:hypothetical protein